MPSKKQRRRFTEILNAAKNAGVLFPEVIAVQWALESGWGKSESGTYNFWGIKAVGNQDGKLITTHEVINGRRVKIKAKFRNFASLEEALIERAKFTKRGGRYDKAGYFKSETPRDAIEALQRGGYATDPNYAKTLIQIMKGVGLDPDYQYPKPKKEDEVCNKKSTLASLIIQLINKIFHKRSDT